MPKKQGNTNEFKCGVPGCNRSFTLRGALLDHTSVVHKSQTHSSQPATHQTGNRIICGVQGCQKNFASQSALVAHRSASHPAKPAFKCGVPECGLAFQTQADLLQHGARIHPKPKTPAQNHVVGLNYGSHQIGGPSSAPLPTRPTFASAAQPMYHSASTPHSIGRPPAAPRYSSNPFTPAPKFDVSRDPYSSEPGNFLGSASHLSTPEQTPVVQQTSPTTTPSLPVDVQTLLQQFAQLLQPPVSTDENSLRPQPMVYKSLASILNKNVSQGTNLRFRGDLQACMDRMRDMDVVSSLVESDKYRAQLMEFSTNMGISDNPGVHNALETDEKDLSQLLWSVLCSTTLEKSVLELKGYEADCFMNLISVIMDKRSFGDDESFYRRAHRLLLKLSCASDKIPSTLFIKGVKLVTKDVASGGFADIHRASYKGLDVALKRVRAFQSTQDNHRIQRALHREALEWQNLKHPYVLPFIGMDSETFPTHFPCIVLRWMSNGTIMGYIQNTDPSRVSIERLLSQVAHGLLYLHSKNVIHGDLHGHNILISDEGNACLTDFGLSCSADVTLGTHTSRPGGTIRWMAPELHEPERFGFPILQRTTESDIYALGCVFLEVSTRLPPFADIKGESAVIRKVMEGKRPDRPPDETMSDGLWMLVQDSWKQQPSDRPKMKDIIERLKAMDFGIP